MSHLPQLELDDRTFQDLVSEARTRISQACPEWTEHNVSDPGITLIELFAWMTELTIYRLNRIPDKLHVALLDLVGIGLDPPTAATVDLRFRLTGPATGPVSIPAASTEVGTPRLAGEEPIVFQTSEDFTIEPLRPAAYVLRRGDEITSVATAGGEARPTGSDQMAFGDPPELGDALHLGFEAPIGRLLMSVDVEASPARGTGVDPNDPPLRWEVSAGDDEWHVAEVLDDATGGFNHGSGRVELQLPKRSALRRLAGHNMHWLRCRLDERTMSGALGGSYAHAPEIYAITAAPIGALLDAAHCSRTAVEPLGVSDGTAGQVLTLRHQPVLPLAAGETLEVQHPDETIWRPWEPRDTFANSTAGDPHFAIDLVAGQITFGPAVREADGGWRQYGDVPPKGAALRFSRYRHGGGRSGNVAGGTLTMLKSSVAGIDTVVNPSAAKGGVDAESLATARQRAALEIRSRHRAVTAEDYECLAREASPRVARARCLAMGDGGAVALHLLPRVQPADRRLTLEELTPDEPLLEIVAAYIDERRTIGATVHLLAVKLRAVSVVVDVLATDAADTTRVEEDIAHALYRFINPLVGGGTNGDGDGWAFERPLNQGELYGVVHAIEGVEYVRLLRIYEMDLATGERGAQPAGTHIVLRPDELLASGAHVVKASHRER